jgi:hypothetical protein
MKEDPEKNRPAPIVLNLEPGTLLAIIAVALLLPLLIAGFLG